MRSVFVNIHQAAVQHNYRLLATRAGRATTIAVVKADAYGHTLVAIIPALYQAGCRHFAVTDANEGMRLRLILSQLGDNKKTSTILLLSGIADKEDARLCKEQQLTPVLAQNWQISALQAVAYHGYVWIKIDTGMQRTGALKPLDFFTACRYAGLQVQGILSHLACADTPPHPLNMIQIERFQQWRLRFSAVFSNILANRDNIQYSLLNSAGLAAFPKHVMNAVRPGIALYGAEPCSNISLGLMPVMHFGASIVQCRDVLAGESIGYGASFVARSIVRIGIVSAGYADGVPRLLSNKGSIMWQNNRLAIIGRVCMDHCMIDLTNTKAEVGDKVWFWNQCLTANEVANTAQTIAYELFTSISQRVQILLL
ncbi:MAG: alanine racemase [Mariprofundales bacterium]